MNNTDFYWSFAIDCRRSATTSSPFVSLWDTSQSSLLSAMTNAMNTVLQKLRGKSLFDGVLVNPIRKAAKSLQASRKREFSQLLKSLRSALYRRYRYYRPRCHRPVSSGSTLSANTTPPSSPYEAYARTPHPPPTWTPQRTVPLGQPPHI